VIEVSFLMFPLSSVFGFTAGAWRRISRAIITTCSCLLSASCLLCNSVLFPVVVLSAVEEGRWKLTGYLHPTEVHVVVLERWHLVSSRPHVYIISSLLDTIAAGSLL
jgi:hypothetical protein